MTFKLGITKPHVFFLVKQFLTVVGNQEYLLAIQPESRNLKQTPIPAANNCLDALSVLFHAWLRLANAPASLKL